MSFSPEHAMDGSADNDPRNIDLEDIYKLPSQYAIEAQYLIDQLKDLGADCEKRWFTGPDQVNEYIKIAPFIEGGIPNVEVTAIGEDIIVPNLFLDDDGTTQSVSSDGLRPLMPYEEVRGIADVLGVFRSEHSNESTNLTHTAAQVMCRVLIDGPPIILPNTGTILHPQRHAIVPINHRSQIEVVEIAQFEQKVETREALVNHLGDNLDAIRDVNDVVVDFSRIEEEIANLPSDECRPLKESYRLAEANAKLLEIVSSDTSPEHEYLVLDFYRAHLSPLLNQYAMLTTSTKYPLCRVMTEEGDPSPSWQSLTLDEEPHAIKGKISELIIGSTTPKHKLFALLVECPQDDTTTVQIAIPVDKITDIFL